MCSDGGHHDGRVVSAFSMVALRPPMPSHSSPWNVQFTLGFLINEQPFLGLYWLAAGTLSALIAGSSACRCGGSRAVPWPCP